MNIVLLTDADVFAGTERHILDLGVALVARGQTVTIACPVPAPLADKARAAGIRVLAVAKRRMPDFSAVKILAAELRAGRVDIIHAHNGRTHLLAVAAVKLAGRGRVVATQHFLAPNRTGRRGPKAWLAGMLHRWAEKNTAAFIAISQAVKDQMLIRGDAPAEKITVVHNGTTEPEKTSAERIAALRAELGVGDGLMVFCAARLQKEKDIPTLIKAMGAVAAAARNPESRIQNHEDNASGQVYPAGQNSSAALPKSSASCLPSSVFSTAPTCSAAGTEARDGMTADNKEAAPMLFIAGEGDQREECEGMIAALSGLRVIGDRVHEVTGERLQGTGDGGAGEVVGDGLQVTGLAGQPAGRGVDGDGGKNSEFRIQTREGDMDTTPSSANTPFVSSCLSGEQTSPVKTSENLQPATCSPRSSASCLPSSVFSSHCSIYLLGFRSDVAALMAACDIFVLPAPAEPFGLVLIEAMAMGKPVIAAAAGGPLEIVADGETGLLFEPGDAASLAAAMRRLLENPDLRQRMGQAGRRRYEEMFTAQRMAENMAAVYESMNRDQ